MTAGAARLVSFGLAAALVALVGLLAGRALSRAMMFPASQEPLPPARPGTRSAPGLLTGVAALDRGEDVVAYAASDGVLLRGYLVRSGRPGVPRLLFFHGNGESNVHNLEFARALAAEGLDVFLAEYRGYGGCAGRPTEAGLYRDGEAALRAVPENDHRPPPVRVAGEAAPREPVPSGPLVLVGRSLGTGVAVELASRGAGALVILISPYTSMVEMGRIVAGPIARLLVADRFDSLGKAPRVAQPVVVLHGTRDELIPFEQGRRLAAAFPHARFVPLEGRGHNDVWGQPEAIAAAVREWQATPR